MVRSRFLLEGGRAPWRVTTFFKNLAPSFQPLTDNRPRNPRTRLLPSYRSCLYAKCESQYRSTLRRGQGRLPSQCPENRHLRQRRNLSPHRKGPGPRSPHRRVLRALLPPHPRAALSGRCPHLRRVAPPPLPHHRSPRTQHAISGNVRPQQETSPVGRLQHDRQLPRTPPAPHQRHPPQLPPHPGPPEPAPGHPCPPPGTRPTQADSSTYTRQAVRSVNPATAGSASDLVAGVLEPRP